MLTTDTIVVLAIAFFALMGWLKGFLRTFMGLLALFLALFLGYIYFQKTKNLGSTLLITLFGPFVLSILLSIVLSVWHKTIDKKASLFWGSRLAGSMINGLWGTSLIIMLLLFIAIFPSPFPQINQMRDDILSSRSYALIELFVKDKIPVIAGVERLLEAPNDPKLLEELRSTEEFQDIYQNERFQKVLSDQETRKQMQTRNIAKLLSNPRIIELLQDEELVEKIMGLNKALFEKKIIQKGSSSSSLEVYEVDKN